ncbi:unnamed protein product, partial [Rotaria socialis]
MKDKAAVAKANSIINGVKTDDEAGLPHLGALSEAVERPIRILDENGDL